MLVARTFLIPAHAGVIPLPWPVMNTLMSYPRACGGDPGFRSHLVPEGDLSPRMRG